MILHVLPGDAYTDTFRKTGIDGVVAIFREALVEGEITGDNLSEFLEARERYHAREGDTDHPPYRPFVSDEIEKLLTADNGDLVNLWFEYELFCSVNYWFCLYMLRNSEAEIYRIAPVTRNADAIWQGFGDMSVEEMTACWHQRVKISRDEIELGSALWIAFRSRDRERLFELGEEDSPAFPYLAEVTQAAAELDTKPADILRDILSAGHVDLKSVFPLFARAAGVYGFGDTQVKRLMEQVKE